MEVDLDVRHADQQTGTESDIFHSPREQEA